MPVNPKAKLVENILDIAVLEQAPTRAGYGEGLVMAADESIQTMVRRGDIWYH